MNSGKLFNSEMNVTRVTQQMLETWANDPKSFVAIHLKRQLEPVESTSNELGVVYPPTYADIGYNIDTLADGKKVALLDSVGAQANRMEPIFMEAPTGMKENPLARLIPQIYIIINEMKYENALGAVQNKVVKRSVLELAHRIADATVTASKGLNEKVKSAFHALKIAGDAGPLCRLAPTSLVFGVWDSRGSGEKRPRLVRSIIRAWDVEELHVSAQFNSIWKLFDDEQKKELSDAERKKNTSKLSNIGLADAPVPYSPGGVLVKGRIEQDITVNLLALRGTRGVDEKSGKHIRRYLLGLSLLAATANIDMYLREGCHLRYKDKDEWLGVPRRGKRVCLNIGDDAFRKMVYEFTAQEAEYFRKDWPETLEYRFDINSAKKLLEKKAKDTE